MDNNSNFEPLFEPGFHDISLENIEEIFSNNFVNSNNRKYLVERLMAFFNQLMLVGIDFEIWIDGSFATKKENPNDIDIAVIHDPKTVNELPEDKKKILVNLFNDKNETRIRYSCDVYFIQNDKKNHRSYWRGWFGFSRTEKPKGIPRIYLSSDNN